MGKVTLSMLLHRYPEIGKVLVLVRPGTGGTAEARFFGKVTPSRPFDPLREHHGPAFDAFLQMVPAARRATSPTRSSVSPKATSPGSMAWRPS